MLTWIDFCVLHCYAVINSATYKTNNVYVCQEISRQGNISKKLIILNITKNIIFKETLFLINKYKSINIKANGKYAQIQMETRSERSYWTLWPQIPSPISLPLVLSLRVITQI